MGSAQLPGDRDVHGAAADALVSKSSSYTQHRKGFKLLALPQTGQQRAAHCQLVTEVNQEA